MIESTVAVLRRHVEEAERRVARQKALIDKLARLNAPGLGGVARTALAVLETSLRLAHDHLAREIKRCGDTGDSHPADNDSFNPPSGDPARHGVAPHAGCDRQS